MQASLGLYLSIPFCRAKCSFCNFASDAFAPGRLPAYLRALTTEIRDARNRAESLDVFLPERVDTIYLGGGTPSLLSADEVRSLFQELGRVFSISKDAEITVECAPGQLKDETLTALLVAGANRLSFGVQSFVDRETAAVGRLHTGEQCLAEIKRVRGAGIENVSLDLIAGLPHQTAHSWERSLARAIEVEIPHVSVYLLELDEDSRLGREVLDAGSRYGAKTTPSEDEVADAYEVACMRLEDAGLVQYEISNFARKGYCSSHNLKYWQRQPYLGFGLDAHSMLESSDGSAVRFANTDNLDRYEAQCSSFFADAVVHRNGLSEAQLPVLRSQKHELIAERLTTQAMCEEMLFLGLRMNEGLSRDHIEAVFPKGMLPMLETCVEGLEQDGLVQCSAHTVALTPRGRLLSNEVFARLLAGIEIS